MSEFGATIRIPAETLQRWDALLNQKRVDYALEGLPENRCVFFKTAKFSNGLMADIKVCTNLVGGDIYSEMVVYDGKGHDLWLSDAGSKLSGEWRLGGLENGEETYYRVKVEAGDDVDAYQELKITREDFVSMVRQELESGVTSEYSAQLAEAIADAVAEDVRTSADEEWSVGDLRLGSGRALLQALGVSV